MRFTSQVLILDTALSTLDSLLADITTTLQGELFDDELDAADALLKAKFLRAAGALAGVALERHLASVARAHQIKITKRDPTVSDLNDPLKAAGILDTPMWRLIQRLGDLRNSAATRGEESRLWKKWGELIDGVRRIVKTVL